MMAAMVELSGGGRIIAAVLIGFVLGFLLVKSGLSDAGRLRRFLTWRDAGLWQIVTTATFLAALFTYFLYCRRLIPGVTAGGTCFLLLAGGALCGLGMMTAGATPLTSLAALASGRIRAIWFFCGGATAVWALRFAGDLTEQLPRWGGPVRSVKLTREFWVWENPLLWVAAAMLAAAVVSLVLGWRAGAAPVIRSGERPGPR